ncbi:MAG TPA: hypothetical protein VM347_38945 [Nonomuraea sp.]|nr:hypothetical protein [Nonomuraea sp.]
MADKLPFRVCDLCGGVDDHPRHVIAGVIDDEHAVNADLRDAVAANLTTLLEAGTVDMATVLRVSRDFEDTTSSDRHKDCCAAAGCPTGTCGQQIEGAEGKTGASLRKHIMANVEG